MKPCIASPEFDYGWMCIYFTEKFAPEDQARLIELGWEDISDFHTFGYRAEG